MFCAGSLFCGAVPVEQSSYGVMEESVGCSSIVCAVCVLCVYLTDLRMVYGGL